GLDWRVDLDAGWTAVGHDVAVQGNLDPAALLGPPSLIRQRVKAVLDRAARRPGHIFNLGHGVHQETPVDHVRLMVDLVHELSDPTFGLLLGAPTVAAFLVGFLKTSVSAGTGLVLTSTLSLVLPAPIVLGLISPLLLMSDPIAMRFYWRKWDSRQLRLLVPAAILGILAGTWALTLLSEVWLR